MFCQQKRDRVFAAGLWTGSLASAASVLLLLLTATAVDPAGAFSISSGMGGVTTGGAGIGRGGFGGGAPKKRRQGSPSPFPAGWRADRKAPRPLKQRPQSPTKRDRGGSEDAAGEGATQTKAVRQQPVRPQAGAPPAADKSPTTSDAQHAAPSIDEQIRQAKRVRAQREHAKAPPPSPAASRVDVAALFRPPRQDLLDGMLSESGVAAESAASVDVARASVGASSGALDNDAPPVTTPANDATSEVPPVTSAADPGSDGPQAPAPAVAESPAAAPTQPTTVATPSAGAEQKLPKDLGAAIRDAARKAKLQRQAREAAEAAALAEAQGARRSHAQAIMDGRDDGQGVSTGAPPSVEQPLKRVPDDAAVESSASPKADEPLEPAVTAAPEPPKEAPRPSNNDL